MGIPLVPGALAYGENPTGGISPSVTFISHFTYLILSFLEKFRVFLGTIYVPAAHT